LQKPFALKFKLAAPWWLKSVVLATQETEIRRIKVQTSPGKIVSERLYLGKKKSHHTHKKWAGIVAQDVGLEFKPQY
jgi:hypothetical protein